MGLPLDPEAGAAAAAGPPGWAAYAGSRAIDAGLNLYSQSKDRKQRRWEVHKELDQRQREMILDLILQAIQADTENKRDQAYLGWSIPQLKKAMIGLEGGPLGSGMPDPRLNRAMPQTYAGEGGAPSLTPGGPAADLSALIPRNMDQFQAMRAGAEQEYASLTPERFYVERPDPLATLANNYPNFFDRAGNNNDQGMPSARPGDWRGVNG